MTKREMLQMVNKLPVGECVLIKAFGQQRVWRKPETRTKMAAKKILPTVFGTVIFFVADVKMYHASLLPVHAHEVNGTNLFVEEIAKHKYKPIDYRLFLMEPSRNNMYPLYRVIT